MPRVPTTCLALSTRECKLIFLAGPVHNPLSRDLRVASAPPGTQAHAHPGIRGQSGQAGTLPQPAAPIGLRRPCCHRYNQGMSATEKLAISLPKDLIEKLRRAKAEGRIDSVSAHIAELLRREDDWRDARATLDRIFERCPGPEAKHYAWARRALGVGPKPVG